MSVSEYLKAFRTELERLKPGWGATSHGIVLDEETGELNLILVCGDVVMPYVLSPDNLADDPVAAAQTLWPKVDQALDDSDHHHRITHKT